MSMPQQMIRPDSQGKVRDLYDLGDKLLIVASDRISAFDYILRDEIPNKGKVLTQISLFWFKFLNSLIPNHFLSSDLADLPERFKPYASWLDGRFMLVKTAKMLPIECIVRGYLAGSGLKEYKASGTICGIKLPEGLKNSSKLPEPVYTPSTKANLGEHDENISFERTVEILGSDTASALRSTSIALYKKAADYAYERGIIIADTKFEFGLIDGKLVLADEALTPDSSRFWPLDIYEEGHDQPSFDKQYVRDWLDAHWDRSAAPPRLPQELIDATAAKYVQAYELLVGHPLS